MCIRDSGMDDVAGHTPEPPPFAGGHDDGQSEQEEADAIATVFRLEVAGTVPDPAYGAAGNVGHAHPGAADRPQRQRQAATVGLGPGPRGSGRGFAPCSLTVASAG